MLHLNSWVSMVTVVHAVLVTVTLKKVTPYNIALFPKKVTNYFT